jgi:hypothetical protein
MIIELWARSPIYFFYIQFQGPSLEPHQTAFHPNIGIQIREVVELGMFTLA